MPSGTGVIAVAVFGLYGAATSKWDMSAKVEESGAFDAFWDAIAFIVNAIVFFFSGVACINFFVRYRNMSLRALVATLRTIVPVYLHTLVMCPHDLDAVEVDRQSDWHAQVGTGTAGARATGILHRHAVAVPPGLFDHLHRSLPAHLLVPAAVSPQPSGFALQGDCIRHGGRAARLCVPHSDSGSGG